MKKEFLGTKSPYTYFLRLFFWLAAIFSLAVSGTTFAGAAFSPDPTAGFAGVLSSFRPFPFGVPLSLMSEYTVRQNKNPPDRKSVEIHAVIE